jgi:transposase
MHTHQRSSDPVATIGLDIGKNTFHLVGLDKRGAVVMRIKVSRNSFSAGLSICRPAFSASRPGSGSHHIARQSLPLGHDVRLIPAQYVKPFLKGHKNDFRDAEAVQRPTMRFVAIKTPEQSDLLSLDRVRSRLVRRRTAIINQIRGFLIERGITVREGPRPLRKVLPEVLSSPPAALSPRILRLIAELDEDWRRLDERIEAVSAEIENLSEYDAACERLMTVPGIGPIISSAVVAPIGGTPLDDNVGGMHKEGAQVSVNHAWRFCRAWCDRRSTPAGGRGRATRRSPAPA